MEHVKKVIEALSKKENHEGEVKSIDLIHTAVSYVFLTGKNAYKLNKPLNLGFLDYTTLEKRKEILEKELELNKMLCHDMYKEVLPVTEEKGEIKLNGKGKVIEYALKMREFSQDKILTNLLKENKASEEDMIKIADKISDFHRKTESSKEISKYGTFDAINELWKENFKQTEDFKDKTISTEKFNFVKDKIDNFLEENKEIFDKRVEEGKVKYNHGDFHSGNICVDKEVYIFDRIVFNMRFPCSDVAAEVAFLAMDLDFHGRKDLSESFVDAYIEKSKDDGVKELLNFYKCYRAYIRGKIGCFKLQDSNISEEERNKTVKEAKSYFDLSYEYSKLL